jgi:hypothetical protein
MLPIIKTIRHFKKIQRDQSGAVAIMFAIFLNVMIAALALSMDLGRAFLAGSEMQNAATAGAIASAVEDGDEAEAKDYFAANLPSGLHSIDYNLGSDVAVEVVDGAVSVIPTNFKIPAIFSAGRVSGQAGAGGGGGSNTLEVSSISTVGLPTAEMKPADYFFVLDVSGSMNWNAAGEDPLPGEESRIDSLRNAVRIVIDNVIKLANLDYGISLVQWSTNVRSDFPLSTDYARVQRLIDNAIAAHSTCGSCGLNAAKAHIPESVVGHTKIVIFMTDGEMNTTLDGSNGENPPNQAVLDAAMQEVRTQCDDIKTNPEVSFWGVTFGSGAGGSKALMDYCASTPAQSIHAADGAALQKIFSEIFMKTGKIRVTK